jgi:RND family efflux transporter MFP subunit
VKRFVIVLIAMGFLSACSEPLEPVTVYQSVATFTPVATDSYQVTRLFIGRISASQQANISFEAPGKVEELYVDQGQKVAVGDNLARLDVSLLQTQAKELLAQLQDTKSRKTLAENSLRRQRDLKVRGFSAEQRVDELISEVESLAATKKRLTASLSANDIRLKKAVLKAPFSGVVSRRFIDAGMVVDPSQPVFQIIDEGGLELKVGMPANMVNDLVTGESYLATVAGIETQATYISASAHLDHMTQTVPVRFALNGVTARDGQMGVVSIIERHQTSGYWVPVTSVTEGMRGSWVVYGLSTVEGMLEHKLLQQQAVEILHVDKDHYYVKADISGDIVVSGLQKAVPGQIVEIVNTADTESIKPETSPILAVKTAGAALVEAVSN